MASMSLSMRVRRGQTILTQVVLLQINLHRHRKQNLASLIFVNERFCVTFAIAELNIQFRKLMQQEI